MSDASLLAFALGAAAGGGLVAQAAPADQGGLCLLQQPI